jgi:flagellar hook protein FlgE
MIDPVTTATTALNAFRKKLDVTANNIANVNSDEFKKSRTALTENANGGVRPTVQTVETPGTPKETYKNGAVTETTSSNVDLTEELTNLIPTRAGYEANLKTIHVSDEMMGSLLDILG